MISLVIPRVVMWSRLAIPIITSVMDAVYSWLLRRSLYIDITLNSSHPSFVSIRQWIVSALVQIMACHLFGAKPLSKPMLGYCQWNLRNKLQWNFSNTKLFINEMASENIVCQMTVIFSTGRWVNAHLQLNELHLELTYTFLNFSAASYFSLVHFNDGMWIGHMKV